MATSVRSGDNALSPRAPQRKSKDGILGSEELSRYFPTGKVNIMIITWNMAGNEPPSELDDLLLPESMKYVPDIYAIGLEEADHSELEELETRMQTTIGPSHVLLHSVIHGVLCLTIFVRRDIIWFFSEPEDDVYNTRLAAFNMMQTKGALGISFKFFGTSFLFICSHLPAHDENNDDRKEEYENIISELDLPENLKPLKPRYENEDDVTDRFDVVFWFGDLNFRIEKTYEETRAFVKNIKVFSHDAVAPLLEKDQLTCGMKDGSLFRGFREVLPISFPPTFKYTIGSQEYDEEKMRVPSYTDRILVRSKKADHVTCSAYDSIRGIQTSDHRPVMALLEVHIKAGDDTIPLNAGLFKRDIYVEGLRRRAEAKHGKKASEGCAIS